MDGFEAGRVPGLTFGQGTRKAVGETLARSGVDGPVLLVADAVLAELGPAPEMAADLARAGFGVELAADIAGEPKEAMVDSLATRARELNAGAVIGLGGGAAMDTAKLVATVAGTDMPAGHFALGRNGFPDQGLPAIAVPTTAGTGSEVTRTSIVSTADGVKYWYWGEELMFAHAFLDPELTVSLPPAMTAWTGIDAVAHALEAITSRKANLAGRLFATEALCLLGEYLPRAVADGNDLEARGHVLWASTVAGLALHNCNTHMGHNISHALGSLISVHHGLATGLALEVTLPWLVEQPGGTENYALAAAAIGGANDAAALPSAYAGLMRSIGIPPQLPARCDGLTAHALAEQMKSPANRGMAANASCEISNDDLDRFAAQILDLCQEEVAA